ncbi:hypothetical protein AGMMS50222_10550 [Endomicrobiia bacterium]|nr:hypothetical protein AGMMS50222_10550 [Endomicrobiia bacterium]
MLEQSQPKLITVPEPALMSEPVSVSVPDPKLKESFNKDKVIGAEEIADNSDKSEMKEEEERAKILLAFLATRHPEDRDYYTRHPIEAQEDADCWYKRAQEDKRKDEEHAIWREKMTREAEERKKEREERERREAEERARDEREHEELMRRSRETLRYLTKKIKAEEIDIDDDVYRTKGKPPAYYPDKLS